MDTITKAAVVTWLLERKIKLVHVWKGGDGKWSCMVETPPCGRRGGALTYPAGQRVGCGVADTAVEAVIRALENAEAASFEFRLHMLEFLVEHLANRAGPALLRRIEGGNSRS